MNDQPTLLKALLIHRHWQKYETFCEEYNKAARILDARLERTWPSRSQYYRWLSGNIKNGTPHPDSCRVLEQLFPEWSATDLFATYSEAESLLGNRSGSRARAAQGQNQIAADYPANNGQKKSFTEWDAVNGQADVTTPSDQSGANGTREGADVNRFEFIQSLFFTALGAGMLNVPEGSVHAHDVARYQRQLSYLYELDDQHGGAAPVYELTLRTMRKLRDLAEYASYDSDTGRGLYAVIGQVTEHAGWLAYDAGRHVEARHWWLEALHSAQMIDDHNTIVVVLASMSHQAAFTHRPREAINLAQAAQRATRNSATPRLRALLLSREAQGHAGNRDPYQAHRTFAQAASLLDRGAHDDDPAWIQFFDEADFTQHRTFAALDQQDIDEAEASARTAVANVDENAYPRNFASYASRLAVILASQRQAEEARDFATRAIAHAHTLGSTRVIDQAKKAVHAIAGVDNTPRGREFVEWSSQILGK